MSSIVPFDQRALQILQTGRIKDQLSAAKLFIQKGVHLDEVRLVLNDIINTTADGMCLKAIELLDRLNQVQQYENQSVSASEEAKLQRYLYNTYVQNSLSASRSVSSAKEDNDTRETSTIPEGST